MDALLNVYECYEYMNVLFAGTFEFPIYVSLSNLYVRGSASVHKAYARCAEAKNFLSSKFQEKCKKYARTSCKAFARSGGISFVECIHRPQPLKLMFKSLVEGKRSREVQKKIQQSLIWLQS
jgi:hypothetical protein